MIDSRKPKPCRYDRYVGERLVKHEHLEPLPDDHATDCTGCQPCEHSHCAVCARRHVDEHHPLTCVECVGSVREDLAEIRSLCRGLRDEAANAGGDGRLAAAAPIPGATAMVLIGPSVAEAYRTSDYGEYHRAGDPEPPISVLAGWEDAWREWLDHDPAGRASVRGAVTYLDQQLTYMAQRITPEWRDGGTRLERPPDFPDFAAAVGRLRAQLEHALHDEQAPEYGVGCFECGARLVRRFRDPGRCDCPPPPVLPHAEHGRCTCTTTTRVEQHPTPAGLPGTAVTVPVWEHDPDDGHTHERPDLACIACHREREWADRHAGHDQGGLTDPEPGVSWECPSCRMRYTPGEYVRAVRSHLLDEDDERGWTSIRTAAEVATDLTARLVSQHTIRTWAEREKVGTRLTATRQRQVFWPDVVEAMTATRRGRGGRVA